jgi:sporulation-control protein spo0M
MTMFDFLKGGKAKLHVTLDRPMLPYYLGETVHAAVTIEGEKELKIEEARVALVCHEEYEYRYESHHRDSDGHHHTAVHTSWATDEQVIQQQVLMGQGAIPSNFMQTYEFSAAIPASAPPTCDGGRIVRVKWMVKATLDRKLAGDIEDKAELLVFATPPGSMVSPGEFGYSNEPKEATLAMALPCKEWVLGETVQGQFLIRPQKAFEATEVRVELVRVEQVPRDRGNESKEEVKVKLAGKTKFEPGQDLTFPFSVAIPSPRPVSGRTRNSSVTWRLRGVLARFLRGDTLVEEEIFVYSGRPA